MPRRPEERLQTDRTQWRGYSGLKTPLRVPKSFFGETLMGKGVALAAFGHAGAFGARGISAPHAMLSSCPLRVTRVCSLAAVLRPLAARPSAALAPSAPAGTMLAMQFSRAGQFNLARLLARKPRKPLHEIRGV